MLTGEDIDRMREEAASQPTKLVVIDTQQFFEIEIPADVDPEFFVNSETCRKECAERILNQTTDLNVDRVLTTQKPDGSWE
ncbi:hypothetical protein HYO99_gp23 [Roseobacter phage RD-1410W1-01]|uniref:Uncharacterized protein n=1 Tax=Roseobacter phage RD-1410W1-01 TaxID=1815984 RepID=A0A191VYG2_9CAUD|nr:hypothetical protein HYO99_gp23 [Roseobacter phage RD-1410W1-01]ANJ20757.1 hypothetical protein RDp01_gp23 [Roseobacter phage RD-1410W1-01]